MVTFVSEHIELATYISFWSVYIGTYRGTSIKEKLYSSYYKC